MVEPGGDLDLPQEALGPQRHRQLRSQDLDRNEAFVLRVSPEKDKRRPTVAELALDRVPASEGDFQATSEVGHGAFDAWEESMIRVSIEPDQMPWSGALPIPRRGPDHDGQGREDRIMRRMVGLWIT